MHRMPAEADAWRAQQVLQVVLAEAAALAQAATEGGLEGAAQRRAGHALLMLAAAAESALPLPGDGGSAGEGSSLPAAGGAELPDGACSPGRALVTLQAAAAALLHGNARPRDGSVGAPDGQ